jgi:hypothetical protein
MYVRSLKNAADRTIGKELGISDGMPKSTINSTQRVPMIVNVAVDEERRLITSIGNESSICKLECLAKFWVIGKAGGIA